MEIEDGGPETVEVVSQEMLIEYLQLQNRVAGLKETIKASLEKGASVERGDITAKLQTSKRRSPKWKDELKKIVGADKIKEITEATPEIEIVALKVDVKKQAMM
jgi:hypothetical protein